MTYRHPLAFLLGLEGVALLRAYAGDGFARGFTEDRIAELRALLAHAAEFGEGADFGEVDTVAGYRAWSATYDEPGNPLIDVEQPLVRQILDRIPPGRALDAACGTGRHAAYLSGLGHQVLGVDSSPEMLTRARQRVPGARFLAGSLHRLPVGDGTADVAVCALGPDGRPALLPASRHLASDYLTAALSHGLELRGCAEPRWPPSDQAGGPLARTWSGAAADAAYEGTPAAIIWHFQRAGG